MKIDRCLYLVALLFFHCQGVLHSQITVPLTVDSPTLSASGWGSANGVLDSGGDEDPIVAVQSLFGSNYQGDAYAMFMALVSSGLVNGVAGNQVGILNTTSAGQGHTQSSHGGVANLATWTRSSVNGIVAPLPAGTSTAIATGMLDFTAQNGGNFVGVGGWNTIMRGSEVMAMIFCSGPGNCFGFYTEIVNGQEVQVWTNSSFVMTEFYATGQLALNCEAQITGTVIDGQALTSYYTLERGVIRLTRLKGMDSCGL